MNYLVAFVSLGCDKNLVDSENMLGLLHENGYVLTSEEDKADVLIVNTCCFIEDAKKESIENILQMAQYKQSGRCKALIVTGCMAQRYKQEILDEIPEVDAVLGTTSYDKIVSAVNETLEKKDIKVQHFDVIDREIIEDMPRILTTAGYYAYIKIAEGCNNKCTYCIIPKLRGKYRSRSIENIEKEVVKLSKSGVSEVILIAQDTTKYGEDLEDTNLVKLIRTLSKIEDIEWIRLLYCYPENITEELINEIKTNPKVCKYIDMPIQHASDNILKRMGRRSSNKDLKSIIYKLRKEIPDVAIRTTLITGFPGETEEDFNILCDFVKEMKFDRLGVFAYSMEEGTKAAEFSDQIEEDIKQKRRDLIMKIQRRISKTNNHSKIGKIMKVLVEGKIIEEDVYVGRTYQDAPDIDGQVFIDYPGELISGDYVYVKIVKANDYDLIGEIVDEYSK